MNTFCFHLLSMTQVCDTYPAELLVPQSVTLPVIVGSSKFRSRGRFPTLSYYYKENHVSVVSHLAHSLCASSIHPPLLMRLWRILSCPSSPCLPNILSSDGESSEFTNITFLF